MKNIIWIVVLLSAYGMLSVSCNDAPQRTTASVASENQTKGKKVSFRDISVEDLPSAYGADPYIIIDVRTPEEIAGGMIDNAIHIDYVSTDFEDRLKALEKNDNYVVYCRSGGRSGKTLEKMKKLGFRYVANLEGGYLAYTAAN